MRLAAPILLLVLLAGCVAPSAVDPASVVPEVDLPTIVQEHDHLDPTLHLDMQGLERVGAHTLAPDNGTRDGWMTSEIIVRGDFAYVAYLGAPWLLAIVDISDPAAPKLVSQWATANAWGMDLAVSDDGDWVFVAIYPHAVGQLYDPNYVRDHLMAPTGVNTPGVAVVDARDRAAPKLSSFMPVHGLGPHTVGYHRYPDGREVVFANKADVGVGNSVTIAEVLDVPTGKALRPASVWWLDNAVAMNGILQPHDVDASEHPITGQTLLYVAYTEAGIAIVDISDPAQPTLVSRTQEGPEGADALMHDIHPYDTLLDGKHYTIASPEIITGETSGVLRVYETTDPSDPTLVGTWRIPGEYVTVEEFGFSMHNFQFMPDGRLAIAHGHAGVWLVDWISSRGVEPVATSYNAQAFPDAVPPTWAPIHGTPWFWGTAVDERGVLWASDSMGGLVSFRETNI